MTNVVDDPVSDSYFADIGEGPGSAPSPSSREGSCYCSSLNPSPCSCAPFAPTSVPPCGASSLDEVSPTLSSALPSTSALSLAPHADASLPIPSPPGSPSQDTSLATEKILYFQHLGYQPDLALDELHLHANGVPHWPPVSSACVTCCSAPMSSTLVPDMGSLSSPLAPPVAPDLASCTSQSQEEVQYVLNHVMHDQLWILWHQCLGHMHQWHVHSAHCYANGVPPVPMASKLDKCPICLATKLCKAAHGTDDSHYATQCGQGISVDFAFIVQKSSMDSNHVHHLQGKNGETCYCLIVDHFSGMLHGATFHSKAPPMDFINCWLVQHGLPHDVPDKYIYFDLGGELGHSTKIVKLFEDASYAVEPTAPNSSHQNGPGECPHQTISDGICTMLTGAGLALQFWPYAFHHFLHLYNVTIHDGKDASPFELCTG